MAYFNYHARIKNKIAEGKLLSFEFKETYNNISPALVLYFSDGSVYPVRQHRFEEYLKIISGLNAK